MATVGESNIENWKPATRASIRRKLFLARAAGCVCIATTLAGICLFALALAGIHDGTMKGMLLSLGFLMFVFSFIAGVHGVYLLPWQAKMPLGVYPADEDTLNDLSKLCEDDETRAAIAAALVRNRASVEGLLECDAVALRGTAEAFLSARRRTRAAEGIDSGVAKLTSEAAGE